MNYAVDCLRHRSIEMQRSIEAEALVDARDHAREEAIAFRRSEEAVIDASREARGRGEPSVLRLRQQLQEAQQELVAAPSPQSVREHADELRAARLEVRGQVRTIAFLCHSSSAQAKQEASASLELLRANNRLAAAQRIIE